MALFEWMFDSRPLMLLAAAAVAGGVFLAVHAGGQQTRELGLSLDEELARGLRLEGERHGLIPRLSFKLQIAQDVIAGHRTLLEAAAHFRAADQQPPQFDWEAFRSCHPGPSQEERHCQEVMAYVVNQLSEDPCLAEALVDRLKGELAEHLRKGTLVLPEVEPAGTALSE